jgi:hypothetical protein
MAGSGNKKILSPLKNDLKAAQKKIVTTLNAINSLAKKSGTKL